MTTVRSLFCWLILPYVTLSAAEFTIVPTSQEVAVGEQAIFRCQHNVAHVVYWRFNSITVGSSPPSGVSRSTSEEGDSTVLVLKVFGSHEYNGSVINCVAAFLNGSSEVSHPAYLTVFSTYFTPPSYDSGFLKTPTSLIVPIGIKAEFLCQHSSADSIGWIINGTSLGSFHPKNVSTKGVTTPNGLSHALIIGAIAAYNGTIVECVAIFFDGSAPKVAPTATLLIQGPLGPVSNIVVNNSTNIILVWQPPYTLNLSNVEPNIVYCIDVFTITCGLVHVFSTCDITQLYFHYNGSDPRNKYQFIITPRSNVAGAINGTASEPVTGRSIANVSIKTMLYQFDPLTAQIIVSMHTNAQLCFSGQYFMSLWSIDDNAGLERLENPNCSTAIVAEGDVAVKLTLNCELDIRRLCKCNLFYQMPQGNEILNISIASNFELSTHDIQNIGVRAVSDQIHLNYSYASGSIAKGLLAIAHSKESFHCVVMERDNNQTPAIIDDLNASTYYVSLFVVDQQGIPLNRSASLPSIATVQENSTNTEICQAELDIKATVSRIDNNPLNRSIRCIFLGEESSGCVILVHPMVHTSSEILNIKVHYLSRDGDTACINVTLDNVRDSLTVFSYNKVKKMIYGYPVNLTSSVQCVDMNGRHHQIIIGIVSTIVFTCTCMTSVVIVGIVYALKRVHRQVKSVCSSAVHLESYQSENSETSIVFQEISDPISNKKEPNDGSTPEVPTLCTDDIQEFKHSQLSSDDSLRSILLANPDSTPRQHTLNSGIYVYINDNSTLDTHFSLTRQVQVFNAFVEEPILPKRQLSPHSLLDPLNISKKTGTQTKIIMRQTNLMHSQLVRHKTTPSKHHLSSS